MPYSLGMNIDELVIKKQEPCGGYLVERAHNSLVTLRDPSTLKAVGQLEIGSETSDREINRYEYAIRGNQIISFWHNHGYGSLELQVFDLPSGSRSTKKINLGSMNIATEVESVFNYQDDLYFVKISRREGKKCRVTGEVYRVDGDSLEPTGSVKLTSFDLPVDAKMWHLKFFSKLYRNAVLDKNGFLVSSFTPTAIPDINGNEVSSPGYGYVCVDLDEMAVTDQSDNLARKLGLEQGVLFNTDWIIPETDTSFLFLGQSGKFVEKQRPPKKIDIARWAKSETYIDFGINQFHILRYIPHTRELEVVHDLRRISGNLQFDETAPHMFSVTDVLWCEPAELPSSEPMTYEYSLKGRVPVVYNDYLFGNRGLSLDLSTGTVLKTTGGVMKLLEENGSSTSHLDGIVDALAQGQSSNLPAKQPE